jgi:ABC-type Mn2+/Zn2+ transport system permease subunit
LLLQNFFEGLLRYEFLQRALITALIVGTVCGIVGVFLILKGIVFMGSGIAHTAFAGGALGILIGINPFFTILFFSSASAISIGFISEKGYFEDNNIAIGIIFALAMALAILFISLIPTYNAGVYALLFGNVLMVTTEDLILLSLFSILILVVIYFMKKELFFITFDNEMAKATGIPVRIVSYILLLLISLTIVVSLKAIGAILIFAMIITPAAAAYQWSYNLNRIIILSVIFGAISSFFGLYLSYILDIPSGPSIVLLISGIFVISMILSPKRRAGKAIGMQHTDTCLICKKADEKSKCLFCEEEPEIEQHQHENRT